MSDGAKAGLKPGSVSRVHILNQFTDFKEVK